MKKTKLNMLGLWNNYKRYNVELMEISKEEEREKETEEIIEVNG